MYGAILAHFYTVWYKKIRFGQQALTDVALTVSGFACAATALLDTALTPAFTGGELTLD